MNQESWVQERLRWEDWGLLRKEALVFAKGELRRRKWRGKRGGLLPGGHDAESVVSEAVRELLSGNCRLPMGYVREKVRRELERLVRQIIRGLHRLREATVTVSEWDVLTRDGANAATVFERLDGRERNGFEAMAQKEGHEERARLVKGFTDSLVGTEKLVFGHICHGTRSPAKLAKSLGVSEVEARRLRQRLDWRIEQFAKGRSRKSEIRRPKDYKTAQWPQKCAK